MEEFYLFKTFFKSDVKELLETRVNHINSIKSFSKNIAMLLYTRNEITDNEVNIFFDDYINNYIELTPEEIVLMKKQIKEKIKKFKNMEE